MSRDVRELLIGKEVSLFLAPGGTTLPTPINVPSSTFVDLGYTSTDGFAIRYEPTTEDIFAHQELDPLLTIKTAQSFSVTFNMMQWNEDTFALAFGGGTWSNAGGVYTYTPPDTDDDIAEYALVADIEYGSAKRRIEIGRGVVTDAVESSLVNNAAAVMPITLKGLKSAGQPTWNYHTDDSNYGS